MLLTYGFLAFLVNLESLAAAVVIGIFQTFLKKIFKFDISSMVRILLMVGLILPIANLISLVFGKAIF
jgi:hypothetical protein